MYPDDLYVIEIDWRTKRTSYMPSSVFHSISVCVCVRGLGVWSFVISSRCILNWIINQRTILSYIFSSCRQEIIAIWLSGVWSRGCPTTVTLFIICLKFQYIFIQFWHSWQWGCWNASHELRNPSIKIVFPTIERVKNAFNGILPSKRILCFSEVGWSLSQQYVIFSSWFNLGR